MDIDDAFIRFSRSQHPPALLPSEASANGRGKVLLPGETTGNSLTTERSIAQHSCSSLAQSLQQPLGQSLRIIQQVLTSKSRANVDRERSKLSSEDLFKCCLDLYIYIYVRYVEILPESKHLTMATKLTTLEPFFPFFLALGNRRTRFTKCSALLHCWCFQFALLWIAHNGIKSIDKLWQTECRL